MNFWVVFIAKCLLIQIAIKTGFTVVAIVVTSMLLRAAVLVLTWKVTCFYIWDLRPWHGHYKKGGLINEAQSCCYTCYWGLIFGPTNMVVFLGSWFVHIYCLVVITYVSYCLLIVTHKGLVLLKLVLDKALIATFTSAWLAENSFDCLIKCSSQL